MAARLLIILQVAALLVAAAGPDNLPEAAHAEAASAVAAMDAGDPAAADAAGQTGAPRGHCSWGLACQAALPPPEGFRPDPAPALRPARPVEDRGQAVAAPAPPAPVPISRALQERSTAAGTI